MADLHYGLVTSHGIKEVLVEIIAENPEAVNPQIGPGFCAYTAINEAGGHCLVGEAAAKLGWDVPSSECLENAAVVAEEYNWRLTQKAIDYLLEVQRLADNTDPETGLPVAWGKVVLP